MPNIAFLNGRFMPLARARVSVEDRGFQFGDGVYELVRTYRGHPFHLKEHIRRLAHSAGALQLRNPYSEREWTRFILAGIRRAGYPDAKVYIQVTRGTAPRTHWFPERVRPTAVMTIRRFVPLADAMRKTGASVITVPDIRWARCNAKSLNLLPNTLAREEAKRKGAFEALFIREGRVMEGGGSNVFLRVGATVLTPPEGPHILSGITREVVLGLAKEAGVEVQERAIGEEELFLADEIFLTGTTVEVLPVVRVDQKKIGNGRPGETARLLYERFRRTVGQ
jgi:D-alanine transaminase